MAEIKTQNCVLGKPQSKFTKVQLKDEKYTKEHSWILFATDFYRMRK